ncbi:hypothetical protein M514_06846 [Trichuris suis]|uniref:Uncharacterized protein n=1 Tax=Trichuris suis TaxID=68888 RepID=A0A085M4Y7_9BILA|nr:hypothetical protein M513_06846 [Trichuris suis]KFD66746.1 hypothetical protein M514_06846 [Trichuris suis]KHJ41705.1 hypothetical protein D918_08235 [Trichuris suis]
MASFTRLFRFYLLLFASYSAYSNLVRLPVNEKSRAIVEGLLYVRAVNGLMSVIATRILPTLNDEEKLILYNCTQSAKDNQQYAKCLVPYMNTNATVTTVREQPTQRPTNYDYERRKRFADDESPSTLTAMLNWAVRMIRAVRRLLSPDVPSYDSKTDLMALIEEVGQNDSLLEVTKSKSAEYFADLMDKMRTILSEDGANKVLLEGSSFPDWFPKLIEDMQTLVKEMKEIEELPNIKILSPKIFTMQADTEQTMHILSPNLLSLYEQGKHDVKNFDSTDVSLTTAEKKALLELIMEISGGEKIVQQIRSLNKDGSLNLPQQQQDDKVKTANETLESVSSLKAMKELYENLDASYSDEQLKTLRERGYAFLTAEQLKLIYKDQISDQVLSWYKRLTEDDKQLLLQKAIVAIAEGNHTSLMERQAQVPEEVSGLFLSPVINTPQVGEPTVLGFIILSPIVYSPATLSPALLTPAIGSPIVFSPVIISTVALSPVILTPLFISPYILTPTLLTPIILAPMVMTPLILVPKVLTPLILQPGVLSPDILCPRTLSPSILSSHVLFAAILSPRYMSPFIRTNCTVCAFIGSPCIMC